MTSFLNIRRKTKETAVPSYNLHKDESDEVVELFRFITQLNSSVKVGHLPQILSALGLDKDEDHASYLLRQVGKDVTMNAGAESNGDHDANDATITFHEYMEIITPMIQSRDDQIEWRRMFDLFADGKEYISMDDLQTINQEVGMNLTQDDLRVMLKEADKNGDGVLAYPDFELLVKSIYRTNPLDDLSSDEDAMTNEDCQVDDTTGL